MEPVFVLRAQDQLTHQAMYRYIHLVRHLVKKMSFVHQLDHIYSEFVYWSAMNRDKVKIPD